jgi:AraC-like DNA-binding protein
MFLEHIPAQIILFTMLYGGGAIAALIASIYLCLRKGNAFAPDVTPPIRLRRWAAALFAVLFGGHIWWYLFYKYSGDIHSVSCMVASLLDCVGLLTTIPGTLFAMLQDRKRPIWPIVTATIPYAVLMGLNIVYPDGHFIDIALVYILLIYVAFTIYMVYAVRQYGRWLRDNYADLEHKEVWMSHVLVIVLMIIMTIYGFDGGNMTISYIVQFIALALIGLLLWRVETLPQLESVPMEQREQQTQQPLATPSNIEQLLAERCVATQLYLQHDLTLLQLAQTIGTNRTYLSHYFSRQGITYNAYINDLRINHFMSLYREAIAAKQPFTAQQMASDSGYRSYSTFSLAFKQRMGQSVSVWMREMAQ